MRDTYHEPFDALTVGLMCSILGSMLLAITMLAKQLREERRAQELNARRYQARRLRYRASGKPVELPTLPSGQFHLFLSHCWKHGGQDVSRVIKQRLLEMIPECRVFLDVDDLEVIGELDVVIEKSSAVRLNAIDPWRLGMRGRSQHAEAHPHHPIWQHLSFHTPAFPFGNNSRFPPSPSQLATSLLPHPHLPSMATPSLPTPTFLSWQVLCFLTAPYTQSRNCMLELRFAVQKAKQLIGLVDFDTEHGGLDETELKLQLVAADSRYERWGIDSTPPMGYELHAALASEELVEWSRLPPFQLIALKAIAVRLLPSVPSTIKRGLIAKKMASVETLSSERSAAPPFEGATPKGSQRTPEPLSLRKCLSGQRRKCLSGQPSDNHTRRTGAEGTDRDKTTFLEGEREETELPPPQYEFHICCRCTSTCPTSAAACT